MLKFRLRLFLASANMNRSELSNLTGIGVNTISRYCNGTFCKIEGDHIVKLCEFFDCSIQDMILITDNDSDKL